MERRGTHARLPLLVATDPWLYVVARLLLVPAARLYGRFEVLGAGRVPASGPALIVANHPSDIDPILVALPLPRTLRFMADSPQFDRAFVGWCIRRLGAFPVQRNGFGRDAVQTALELLRRGEIVAVFPEGDVHADGIHAFESGAAYLAEKSGAPVIPMAITGAEGVLRGRWWRELPAGWARRPHVRVSIGEPLRLGADVRRRHAAATHLGELVARLRAT
jgi:1-acyl-sn-glycerol-3-phosphate acyltransferase